MSTTILEGNHVAPLSKYDHPMPMTSMQNPKIHAKAQWLIQINVHQHGQLLELCHFQLVQHPGIDAGMVPLAPSFLQHPGPRNPTSALLAHISPST